MSALDTQIGGSHYKDCKIQPVQYIEANSLQFLEGNVVKRITRHDKPTGKGREDIEKAIHELQLILELRYPEAELMGAQMGNKNIPPSTVQYYCNVCLCKHSAQEGCRITGVQFGEDLKRHL